MISIIKKWSQKKRVVYLFLLCGGAAIALIFLTQHRNAYSAMAAGDYRRAAKLLEVMAQHGDAKAQNALGNLYYLGLGVEQNHARASRFYLAAALQENVDAQVNIARQYQNGWGVNRDEMRAYGWLRQARNNHSAIAESYMKWQAVSLVLTPNQIQKALALYHKLDDLRPDPAPASEGETK